MECWMQDHIDNSTWEQISSLTHDAEAKNGDVDCTKKFQRRRGTHCLMDLTPPLYTRVPKTTHITPVHIPKHIRISSQLSAGSHGS